jgi:alginate O-acetyltransferase complex protein AlgI
MQAVDGLDLLAIGYVKKLAFADNFGRFADTVFAHPDRFGALATWVGVLSYAGQIYCDFSAYTDIARGCAKLLGFELPRNFDLPYVSRSITEFWRRWHITLSTWLRDYLYISLGGNRRGKARQYLNLLITMGLGGLWHGASWTFVIWGLFHGVLLLLHKLVDDAWSRVPEALRGVRRSFVYGLAAFALTFVSVCVGWVFFRAPDLATARVVFEGMFGARPDAAGPMSAPMKTAVALLVALAVGHLVRLAPWAGRAYVRAPLPLRSFVWASAAAASFLLATAGRSFIYFQF